MFTLFDVATEIGIGLPGNRRLVRGAYLTDGHRLFRCLLAQPGSLLIFEDCLDLEVSIWDIRAVMGAHLRLVELPA